jgi:hypothetical protein
MVTSLQLHYCNMYTGFWAALDGAFPNLNSLRLGEGSGCEAADLIIYCTRKAAAATAQTPFKLMLWPDLHKSCGGGKLEARLAAQGLPHITIIAKDDVPDYR